MVKEYIQVKVWNRDKTILKETLDGNLLLSEINFTQNLNGGQGELVLEVKKPITEDLYTFWDIVQINKYSEFNKNRDTDVSPTIYTGYVSRIGRIQKENNQQIIELTLLWMASLLTGDVMTYTFNGVLKTGDAIKHIINEYTASFPNTMLHTGTSIADGSALAVWTVEWTRLDCIKRICEMTNMKFFIDADRIVNVFPCPPSPTHYLTNQKNVESIEIYEDTEWIINKVNANNTTILPYLVSHYQDNASIAIFGKLEKTIEVPINWQDAMDQYALGYVNERKDSKKESKVIVNRSYPIELLKPWDTIKIRNFAYSFENIQIIKVSYTPTKCTLYLDKYTSYWEQINSVANIL